MKITVHELESRMAQLPTGVLKDICASHSQYTDDARETARVVLERRAADGTSGADPVLPAPHPVSYAIDDAIAKPFRALRSIRSTLQSRLEQWQERMLPRVIPSRIRELFWAGLTSALPALAVIGASIRSADDVDHVARELATSSSIGILAIGVSGLVLSYGIFTQRTYPRFLAIPFVTLVALWSLSPRRRKEEDESAVATSGTIAWAHQTIQCLVRSSEAAACYDALRSRACAPGAQTGKVLAGTGRTC